MSLKTSLRRKSRIFSAFLFLRLLLNMENFHSETVLASPRFDEKSKISSRSLEMYRTSGSSLSCLGRKKSQTPPLERKIGELLPVPRSARGCSFSGLASDRGIGSRREGNTRAHRHRRERSAVARVIVIAVAHSPPPPPSLRSSCTLTPTSRRRCSID